MAEKRPTKKELRDALETLADIVERQCFTGRSHYAHELPNALKRANELLTASDREGK